MLTTPRIVGVYVSEEDADNEVTRQKQELIDGGIKPSDITDLDLTSGWEWIDTPKIHICSYQFHPLIWPKAPDPGFDSDETSLGDDGIEEPDVFPAHGSMMGGPT